MAYQIYGSYYDANEPAPSPSSESLLENGYNESHFSMNEKFQQLLERPITNSEEANERHADISNHSRHLVETAKDIVKTIVDELHTNKQTYQPSHVGGMAGGNKYIVKEIFIKFPIDNNGLYGGDDIVAAKTAGHELKGLSALISCNIPNLHFPLVCVINYKGYRALVFTRVPIHDSSLVYGSADGGITFHNESYEISSMFSTASTKLNLQPHKVSCFDIDIPGPVDLEGHLGADGRYYAVDFSRLMPAETPTTGVRGSFLFRLLRPEFVHQYAHSLSSDAFSRLAVNNEDHEKVREATTHLHQVKIPKLAQTLPALLENQVTSSISESDLASLKTTLHKHGVNLRQLGLLLYHVKASHGLSHIACTMLALEIIARASKVALFGIMRSFKNFSDKLIIQCAQFLDLLVIQNIMNHEFQKQLEKQFVEHLHSTPAINEAVMQLIVRDNYLIDEMKDHRILLLGRISTLTGIKFNPAKFKELDGLLRSKSKANIGADFLLSELEITSKHINIVPIAEVLRVEGKLAEAHSFLKDELKLRKKVVGEDSLQVAITLTNLAELYSNMGSSKDLVAERCLNRAMEIYAAKLPDSLELALATERLAMFYYRADKHEYAEALLRQVLETKRKLLGNHIEVANTLEYLAWTAHATQRYWKALERYEESIKIKTTMHTKMDPLSIATTLNNIGQTFCAVQKWDDARAHYKKLYELLKAHRGLNHSDCAIALDNLAKLYAQDPETYEEAQNAYEEALKIKKASLGEKHVYTAITQDHLAQLLVKRGQFSEAEDLYKSALATLRVKLGNNHSAVGITLHNIAQLFNKLTQYTGAREAEQEALNIFTYACGPDHQYTIQAKQALDELNMKYGKNSVGDELATLSHSSMNMPVSADKIPDNEKKSKVVYSQLLRDAGIKEEDIDHSLLSTVLAVIQEVKTASRLRMSKSDSYLVLPPARTRATQHTDDSLIKSPSTRKTDKASRSQSSKELISRFREFNRIENRVMLTNEPLFEFPMRTKPKQEPERITQSETQSFSSNRALRRQISNVSSKNLLPMWLSMEKNSSKTLDSVSEEPTAGRKRSDSKNRPPLNAPGNQLASRSFHLPSSTTSSTTTSSTSLSTSPSFNPPPISTIASLKDLRGKVDFKTDSIEFFEDLLAGIQSPPVPPEGISAHVTPHSITLAWSEKKEVSVYVVDIKVGSEWRKVYEGVQETVLIDHLAPSTCYDIRVTASNASGSSPPTYLQATTAHEELHCVSPTSYGNVLRNSVGGSDIDLGEIDELESEIFGKAPEEEEFEAGPAEEDGKDPFFDVFLTSEEYRRVVAAAHDQLHRRKTLAALHKK
eukprot:Phypoly_transcript_00650.p1 GENE.Phypoly_transcript_00650~~Phypoly_transcript_00650.p1  ORF type:complete len:1327 (+),score=210.69 Phypoly_transcript_00650:37-4017(+)